jgi:RNA polymerase sigma-54 factor
VAASRRRVAPAGAKQPQLPARAAEAPANPISDQQIVETLKAEKIDIARRTVAKYRESLGIASSSQRKKIL